MIDEMKIEEILEIEQINKIVLEKFLRIVPTKVKINFDYKPNDIKLSNSYYIEIVKTSTDEFSEGLTITKNYIQFFKNNRFSGLQMFSDGDILEVLISSDTLGELVKIKFNGKPSKNEFNVNERYINGSASEAIKTLLIFHYKDFKKLFKSHLKH